MFVCFRIFVIPKKKPCFSPEKGIFWFIFSVSLSFSLSLFWPPSFSVSLSLSLSFLLFFLSSFLSFLFAFFWFLVFVSFFIFLSSLLFFHERNNIKILNCKFCLQSIFYLFWFPCLFLFQVPFSYLCSFLILSYVFCSTSRFLVFQTNNLKKQIGQKGGCNIFLSTCVLENVKSYRFFLCSFFWGKFGVMFKKHSKIAISAHFLRANNWKNGHF